MVLSKDCKILPEVGVRHTETCRRSMV